MEQLVGHVGQAMVFSAHWDLQLPHCVQVCFDMISKGLRNSRPHGARSVLLDNGVNPDEGIATFDQALPQRSAQLFLVQAQKVLAEEQQPVRLSPPCAEFVVRLFADHFGGQILHP